MTKTTKYLIAGIAGILVIAGIVGYTSGNSTIEESKNLDDTVTHNTLEQLDSRIEFDEKISPSSQSLSDFLVSVENLINKYESSDEYTLLKPVFESDENLLIDYIGFPTYYTENNGTIFAITISNVEISNNYFDGLENTTGKEDLVNTELDFVKSNPSSEEILERLPFIIAYENGTVYGFGGDAEDPNYRASIFSDLFENAGIIDDVRFDGAYFIDNNIFGAIGDNLIYIREVTDNPNTFNQNEIELFFEGYGYYNMDKSSYDLAKINMLMNTFLPKI